MYLSFSNLQKPPEIFLKYDLESEHPTNLKKLISGGFWDFILGTFGSVLGSKIEVKFHGSKRRLKGRQGGGEGVRPKKMHPSRAHLLLIIYILFIVIYILLIDSLYPYKDQFDFLAL